MDLNFSGISALNAERISLKSIFNYKAYSTITGRTVFIFMGIQLCAVFASFESFAA